MVERRLGRGLDFFLPAEGEAPTDDIQSIELGQLVPNPHQPRREFTEKELAELAASIRTAGILQPILVRRVDRRYQIIAGERRWRAAKIAGLERVPALVKEITDEQAAVFGLVENLHREDLNPIEKAKALKRIGSLTKAKHEDVAKQVGLDRTSVTNYLRLLDLPGEVQAHVSRGTLTMGHARALLGLADAQSMRDAADEVLRQRLSVRQVEDLVRSLKAPPPSTADANDAAASPSAAKTGAAAVEQPLWLKEIEDNLERALDTPVQVRYGKKRSKITIECRGRDEFERVYELLKGRGAE